MIIAIDGPSAAGKGTLARRLAEHLGYAHLDTGALYRATGLRVLRDGGNPDCEADAVAAARALDPADTRDPALRSDEAAGAASKVAKIPTVRQSLLEFQRAFAADPPGGAKGAVLDGRDIGTVVCPDADVKLFVTASDEERARRRAAELQAGGAEVIYARVLQDLRDRDARDREREVAPLRPAVDAVELDTTELDADAAFEAALAIIQSRNDRRG